MVLALPQDMLTEKAVALVALRYQRGAGVAFAGADGEVAAAPGSGAQAHRHCRRERLDRRGVREPFPIFPDLWKLPVACAFRFQDVFDNDHPHYAGDVGIGINPRLAQRVREADLALVFGPRPAR